jgi:hypothetical protein
MGRPGGRPCLIEGVGDYWNKAEVYRLKANRWFDSEVPIQLRNHIAKFLISPNGLNTANPGTARAFLDELPGARPSSPRGHERPCCSRNPILV